MFSRSPSTSPSTSVLGDGWPCGRVPARTGTEGTQPAPGHSRSLSGGPHAAPPRSAGRRDLCGLLREPRAAGHGLSPVQTPRQGKRDSPRAASPRDAWPHRGLGTRAALYPAPQPHETLRRGTPGPDAGAASPGSPGPSARGVPWPSVFRDCSKCYHSSRNHATVTGPRLTAKGSRELQTHRDDRRTERHRPPQATAGRGRARRRGGTGHAAPSRPGPPHRSRPRTRGLSPPPARPQRCRRHRRREGADGRGSEKDSKR